MCHPAADESPDIKGRTEGVEGGALLGKRLTEDDDLTAVACNLSCAPLHFRLAAAESYAPLTLGRRAAATDTPRPQQDDTKPHSW